MLLRCGRKRLALFLNQLSWQPFKGFECHRGLHAVPNKQERDAGSPKAKVVMGVDEDMKRDLLNTRTEKKKQEMNKFSNILRKTVIL